MIPRHRRPAGPVAAVERHRLGVVDELHPAALPRPVGRVVATEVVRRQLVELRVDPRAVVALAVVLGDELPVGVDLVRLRVRDAQRREVEPVEMRPRGRRARPPAAGASGSRLTNTKPCQSRASDRDEAERPRG